MSPKNYVADDTDDLSTNNLFLEEYVYIFLRKTKELKQNDLQKLFKPLTPQEIF